MKDISELKLKQFRIFAADTLPFAALNTEIGQSALTKVFSFRSSVQNLQLREWIFEGGTLSKNKDRIIVIERMQLSERRIVTEIMGNTEDADYVYSVVKEALSHSLFGGGDRWTQAEPVVLTHETSCIVTLDFDWSSLLAPGFSKFSEIMLRAASHEFASAQTRGISLGFRLTFTLLDERVKQHSITLADKPFVIEPRQDAPPSDRRYFTTSPTETETHLKLLSQLEEMLAD